MKAFERTLQSPLALMSTVWIARNVDQVAPPMVDTDCPFSVVRPAMFVPEISRPAVLRM